MDAPKVNILVVDDRPDKLLALEAVLDDLHERIVFAHNGQEALRHLLSDEFAVILLDVNMPGMDGFETAQFIRQRRNSAHVPIIFLTAMSDEMHVARGYSLGAVDYMLTPVVPDVLRSKVAVFVDLFKKTQQVRLQAEGLRHRAMQLHRLTSAALAINSSQTVEKIVQTTTETARGIIGAEQAVMIVAPSQRPSHTISHASYSEKHARWQNAPFNGQGQNVHALVRETSKPLRMTHAELQNQGDLLNSESTDHPPLRGLLAVPLIVRDGTNVGVLFLSDKAVGEFSDDDQAVLTQLAQMACIAVENTLFALERESNRVKNEFLSTLSHELRTPLSAIAGWVRLLRMDELDPKVAHGLSVIDRNVAAQLKLIEELLDLSRIQTGKLKLTNRPIALKPVIEAAVDALRPAMSDKKINFDCQLNGHDAIVVGDANRLQQVFWNLLSNATKFTPQGGQIGIRLASDRLGWRVTITDNGVGIDADSLPYVFDRFWQADSTSTRHHGGLGIGLTLVRHIVELHGGTVAAESDGKSRGSTFAVTLPNAPVQAEATLAYGSDSPTAANESMAVQSLASIRVLLVDDEPDTREVVAGILKQYSAEVAAASSAREALNLLADFAPDVMVSDLAMPERDGYSLLRDIRALPAGRGRNIPVIALTAYARPEDRARALAAGFQLHIAKPVDPQSLVKAVVQCARKPALPSLGIDLDKQPDNGAGVEA